MTSSLHKVYKACRSCSLSLESFFELLAIFHQNESSHLLCRYLWQAWWCWHLLWLISREKKFRRVLCFLLLLLRTLLDNDHPKWTTAWSHVIESKQGAKQRVLASITLAFYLRYLSRLWRKQMFQYRPGTGILHSGNLHHCRFDHAVPSRWNFAPSRSENQWKCPILTSSQNQINLLKFSPTCLLPSLWSLLWDPKLKTTGSSSEEIVLYKLYFIYKYMYICVYFFVTLSCDSFIFSS